MSDWKELLKVASRESILARARSCLDKGTRYRLGKGGINPLKPLTSECDCSGFVAWAIGIPRELPPNSGKWLQTTTYWQGGGIVGEGLFDQTTPTQAEPGDLFVYPDVGGKQGHMGIISEVQNGKPLKVIHCSKGNDTRHGNAIRETDTAVFSRHSKSRIMQIDYAALRDLFDLPEPDEDDETELPPSNAQLHHPILAYDTTLKLVIKRKLVLEPMDDYVGGCGALHDALNKLASSNPEYHVDLGDNRQYRGFYGFKTAEAIRHFQRDRGLVVTGETDATTLMALDNALDMLGSDSADSLRVSEHGSSDWTAVLSAVHTAGASAKTARQDGLLPGVDSSHTMARTDLGEALELREKFLACGRKFDVPPALLAAIASRESRCGKMLSQDGTGDSGYGWGVMQVDKRHHMPSGGPYSMEHIEQATDILVGFRSQVKKKHPDWEDKDVLKGSLVAYNSGVSNVQTIERMDVGTTGDDYGSDVIARAQFYMQHIG